MNKSIIGIIFILLLIISISINVWLVVFNPNKVIPETNTTEKDIENTIIIEEKIVEKIVEKVVEKGVFPIYDTTKGKKVKENCIYTGEIIKSSIVGLTINSNGTVNVNEVEKVSGVTGKVVDTRAGLFGDGASGYIILLMSDGSLQISEEYFSSGRDNLNFEKVTGINNIVRIENVMSTRDGRKRATLIAIDKDGYFYDLISY